MYIENDVKGRILFEIVTLSIFFYFTRFQSICSAVRDTSTFFLTVVSPLLFHCLVSLLFKKVHLSGNLDAISYSPLERPHAFMAAIDDPLS